MILFFNCLVTLIYYFGENLLTNIQRKRLKTGTYLHSFCQHCKKELTHDDMLLLDVVNQDGKLGHMELSPFLNVFEHQTDIDIPKGKELKDIRCPHCNESLLLKDKKCELCNSHIASFLVRVSNNKIPFNICMNMGCHWHSLSSPDEDQINLEESDEW